MEKCWGRILQRSVGEECCREVLVKCPKSVVEKFWKKDAEECCREVLEGSV